MAVIIKTLVEDRLKGLTGGLSTDGEKADDKADGTTGKMTREEFEEYQQQLMEEKMERDAVFAKRKAERATMRTIFREKYRLPKSEADVAQIEQVAGAADSGVPLPAELVRIVSGKEDEEGGETLFGGPLPGVARLRALRGRAQDALNGLRQGTGDRCVLM